MYLISLVSAYVNMLAMLPYILLYCCCLDIYNVILAIQIIYIYIYIFSFNDKTYCLVSLNINYFESIHTAVTALVVVVYVCIYFVVAPSYLALTIIYLVIRVWACVYIC